MKGTVRTRQAQARDTAEQGIRRICEGIAAELHVRCDVTYRRGTPSILNEETMLQRTVAAIQAQISDVAEEYEPSLGNEDFSYMPPFNRAAVDGYGVGGPGPGPFQVVGYLPAGADGHPQVGAGEAVHLLTGAAVPEGVWAVAMQERCRMDPRSGPGSAARRFRRRRPEILASAPGVRLGPQAGQGGVRTRDAPSRTDLVVERISKPGSARLMPLVAADGLIRVGRGAGALRAGDAVGFLPFAGILGG